MDDYLKNRYKSAVANSGDPFWRDYYPILTQKPGQIFPNKNYTLNERYNAYTRFIIALICIITVLLQSLYVLVLIPICMIIISLLYDVSVQENFEGTNVAHPDHKPYYDIRIVSGIKCRAPTENNPFMTPNYLVDPPEILSLPACSSVSKEYMKMGRKIYDDRTPYDIKNAISGTDESARRFYSLYTIGSWPPSTEMHAKWLHGEPEPALESCKEHTGEGPKFKYHCDKTIRGVV